MKHILLYGLLLIQTLVLADEGLWLPIFLKQYNEADMQAKGMKITADDIYSINHASIKDAVVLFGGGCSGVIVSQTGLLFTNHHCGYSYISNFSTPENNLIKNGFWAKNYDEEIPCPGLSVTFLISMTDVTASIVNHLDAQMTEKERANTIASYSKEIITNATAHTNYQGSIESTFSGNAFFLCITQSYSDIRFVGAPPETIGKFGGDTDNWMWPRHNADFSMFRIYADSLNNPAEYAKTNKPYTPKKSLAISTKAIHENDFTMVLGYPGATDEYLTSEATRLPIENEIPSIIKVSESKLNVLNSFMQQNEKMRLTYTPRYNSIANGYKKYKGIVYGYKRYHLLEQKQHNDSISKAWISKNHQFETLFDSYNKLFNSFSITTVWTTYFFEALWRNEILAHAIKFRKLLLPEVKMEDEKIALAKYCTSFFKSRDKEYNKQMFISMLERFYWDIPMENHPMELFYALNKYKNKDDIKTYASDIVNKSFLFNEKKIPKYIETYTPKKSKLLFNDPLFNLANSIVNLYITNYKQQTLNQLTQLDSLNRIHMQLLQTIYPDSIFYPDANSTFRISYGTVKAYKPKDAVSYGWQTTLDGVIQKTDTGNAEFNTPYLLQKLYYQKDFGKYAVDSTIPVNFIADCQSTGGNSGSPVLNANGELIGMNFDRNWEGTIGDYDFNPDMCRNISTDFHYILFIIDKIGNAQNLLNELTLVQ